MKTVDYIYVWREPGLYREQGSRRSRAIVSTALLVLFSKYALLTSRHSHAVCKRVSFTPTHSLTTITPHIILLFLFFSSFQNIISQIRLNVIDKHAEKKRFRELEGETRGVFHPWVYRQKVKSISTCHHNVLLVQTLHLNPYNGFWFSCFRPVLRRCFVHTGWERVPVRFPSEHLRWGAEREVLV